MYKNLSHAIVAKVLNLRHQISDCKFWIASLIKQVSFVSSSKESISILIAKDYLKHFHPVSFRSVTFQEGYRLFDHSSGLELPCSSSTSTSTYLEAEIALSVTSPTTPPHPPKKVK